MENIVRGTSPNSVCRCHALIDTGFTGFLMLPVAKALPLGLTLCGTGDYTLADGKPATNFLARGTVTIPHAEHPESAEGAIVLAGKHPLLGMEFLRALNKLLVIGKVVALIDESLLDDNVAGANSLQQHATPEA